MDNIKLWFRERYCQFNNQEKCVFLMRLLREVILLNRSNYNNSDLSVVVNILKGTSELCGRIADQLLYMAQNSARYPDDVFPDVILDHMLVVMEEPRCAWMIQRILAKTEARH